jgi:hypothetical protein
MFAHPASLRRASISTNIGVLGDVHPEDTTEDKFDTDNFIQEISPKSTLEKIKLTVGIGNSVIYPFLFANFIRTFWNIQSELSAELESNIYYRCQTLPVIRNAVSYDGATVRAEGAGLTTTSAVLGGLMATGCLIYLFGDFLRRQCQYASTKNLNLKIDKFIDTLELDDDKKAAVVRKFLYDLPINNIITLLQSRGSKKGLDKDSAEEMRRQISGWQKYGENLSWFQTEINSNYLTPLVVLSVIPAFVITYLAARNLSENSPCETFPLVAYLTDTCDVTEQYENLSLLTYFWDVLSLSGLSVYCLGIFAHFGTSFGELKKIRPWYYENIHKKYFATNPDQWVYKSVLWGLAAYAFTPFIFTYSFIKALNLANKYAAETNCPSLDKMLWAAYTNDQSYDDLCPASSKSMAISGFLGDFEIVKLDFMFFSLMSCSYVLADIIERCFLRPENSLSTEQKIQRQYYFNKAKQLLKKMEDIRKSSWKWTMGAIVIVGLGQLFFAKRFADDVLNHKLELIKDFSSYNISAFSIPDNSTYANLTQLLCPYDNLTAILLAETTLYGNFTLNNLLNTSLPLRLVNNHTIAFDVAEACANSGILTAYLYNIVDHSMGCDPLLVTRAIAAFVGLYWLGISFSTGSTYMLATAVYLLFWGIDSLRKCCQREVIELDDASDEYDDDSYIESEETQQNTTRRISSLNIEQSESNDTVISSIPNSFIPKRLQFIGSRTDTLSQSLASTKTNGYGTNSTSNHHRH